MIRLFPAERRYVQRMGWIDVYSVFSCNNHFDPWNTHFAGLIALNEYVMQPGCGFNMHPHEDVEQVFLVLEGQLSYADSLGNEGVLSPGGAQSITAGCGYARYAYNRGDAPCRYLAAWLTPRTLRLAPRCSNGFFPQEACQGACLPLASGDAELLRRFHDYPPLEIHSNATLRKLRLHAAHSIEEVAGGERQLVYVTEGILQVNNESIRKGGHARIEGKERLRLAASRDAEIILITMWEQEPPHQTIAIGTFA